MLLLLVKGLSVSGDSSGALTSSRFQICGFKIWEDFVSMDVQDFALETFMGATEEAAEHAKQIGRAHV